MLNLIYGVQGSPLY